MHMPMGTCYALSIQSPVIAPSLNCLATSGFAPSHSKLTQPFQRHASLRRPGSPRTDVVSTTATSVPCDMLLMRMLRPGHGWLFNVRSLVNKTFVLNDFFSTTSLDALFLMETWIRPGELLPFSELLPPVPTVSFLALRGLPVEAAA